MRLELTVCQFAGARCPILDFTCSKKSKKHEHMRAKRFEAGGLEHPAPPWGRDTIHRQDSGFPQEFFGITT